MSRHRAAPASSPSRPTRHEPRRPGRHALPAPARSRIATATTAAATTATRAVAQPTPLRASAGVSAAITACLVIGVASPQAAVAAPSSSTTGAGVVRGTQTIRGGTTGAGQAASLDRSGFDVVRPVRERPAVRPVDGAIPDAGNFGGRRVDGCSACSTSHRGTDFAAPAGTTIVSVLDGIVIAAGPGGGYGQMVLVQHDEGLVTRYGHMSAIDVRVGERVEAGARLGAVGSTGISTGPHLHFEVLVDGTAVDPVPWLRARGIA